MAKASSIDVVVKGEYQDKDIKRAISDLQKMQAAGMSAGAKMQAFGTKMQAVGASVAKVGKSLTLGVTLPIVGVGAAATKMAMDFDTSLTKMVSLVGLTRAEVDGMRSDIIRMASQYGKSASEAADAMFFITSAGLRGADAMETLEASLKGAAIGLGDVQTIADLATSAMNAYGPSVLSATKATSILRTAVEQGKLEADELAGAMGSVLPVASAMGVGFDEVAAAMAAMSRTGTDASTASTQVRGILSQIAKETPKGAKALASVGLSYEGLRSQLQEQGLLATLQTLVGAFDGNTVATSAFFGNVRALTGVMDMMGASADTTVDIFSALAQTTADDLNPALDAAAQTTGFKLQQAFAALKNSLIEFGDIIAPFVEQFAARLTQVAQAFQSLSPETKRFIVTAAAIAAALGPVLLIVGKVIGLIGGLIKVVGLVVVAFNPVILIVGAVVLALAGLVIAIKYLWDNSEAFRQAVMQMWEMIRDAIVRVIDMVKQKLEENRESIETLRQAFATIANFIISHVMPVIMTLIGNYLKALIEVIVAVIAIVVKAIEMFVNFVAMLVKVGASVATFVGGVIDWFTELDDNITKALDSIGATVSSVWTGIYTTISNVLGNVREAVKSAINFIIRGWNRLSFSVPGVTVGDKTFGGFTIGVPQIPELAKGGIVLGPTLALIGEAGPEMVLPLTGRAAQSAGVGGTTINLTVNAGMGTQGDEVGRQIVEAIRAYERRSGRAFVAA